MTLVRKRIDAIISDQREWLQNNLEMKDECISDLRASLPRKDAVGLRVASVDIDLLSVFYGSRGLNSLLDGDRNGWRDANRSIMYRYWTFRIKIREFEAAKRENRKARCGYHYLPEAANLFCWALLTEGATELPALNSGSNLWPHAMVDKLANYMHTRRFEPFVYHLRRKVTGEPDVLNAPCESLGPYQQVLEHWDEPDEFTEILAKLCDLHVELTEETSEGFIAAFQTTPFCLLPLEIGAIHRVRRELGLHTPEIRHPLLDLPTADLSHLRIEADPLLEEIARTYNEVYPEADRE